MPHNPFLEIIRANPQIRWLYNALSINPNITWEIVKANQDKNWSYFNLSSNPNITWDIIQAVKYISKKITSSKLICPDFRKFAQYYYSGISPTNSE